MSNDTGEYPIGPEPSPNPRPMRPIHIRVTRLDYESVSSSASTYTGSQFIAGAVFPFAYAIVASMLISALPFGAVRDVASFFALGGFVFAVVLIRWKMEWTGFIPGILCAIFVLPLLLILTCGVIIGGIGMLSALG